jgi:two-component system response regulator ChvI
MGAEDYIRKPFSLRLLIERIRTVLRRTNLSNSDECADDEVEPKIVRGDLVLDPARHECSWHGEGFTLTVTEFLILNFLVSRPGYVRSRNQLMDAAYDDNINVTDRNIDCHIKRIRKKIHAIDKNFTHIETLYGIGYRYKDR